MSRNDVYYDLGSLEGFFPIDPILNHGVILDYHLQHASFTNAH